MHPSIQQHRSSTKNFWKWLGFRKMMKALKYIYTSFNYCNWTLEIPFQNKRINKAKQWVQKRLCNYLSWYFFHRSIILKGKKRFILRFIPFEFVMILQNFAASLGDFAPSYKLDRHSTYMVTYDQIYYQQMFLISLLSHSLFLHQCIPHFKGRNPNMPNDKNSTRALL